MGTGVIPTFVKQLVISLPLVLEAKVLSAHIRFGGPDTTEWATKPRSAAQVSSTGQQFSADSRSFAASFPRIRKGIASSCPIVKITYSNTQPLLLPTLISPHGTSSGGCINRKRNMLAKYNPC